MKELLNNKKVREGISEIGMVIVYAGSFALFFSAIFNWMTTM